jgi:hypothetical protein
LCGRWGQIGAQRLPVAVRFTDDLGLYWAIRPDLHLEKLQSRDW